MNEESRSASLDPDFKLGDWWVRPRRNELERDGEAVQVEARSMSVLVCLGRHAPRLVEKERLLGEVWSDSPFVGDDVISHAIWELRKALGDSAKDPIYIQTVPRKGYRLVAEILRPQGAPLPVEGVRIDHYDLGEEIGRGAMGVVYEAVDRRLDRAVAIKFLAAELTRDPESCRRFEREARVAASLDHPNLATVYEIGETSAGYRYLVGAYYRGGSLKDRLAEGPVPVDEAVRLVRQLVAGLGAAHQRDIVHRDIKPANLLLDEHGTLKICDFGIAKLLGATDLTRTGAPLGTPAYKSPEQALGREVDHRTDLWAAGVVFFELLTGRRPFDGEYEHAVVQAILSREPRDLGEASDRPIPESLGRFVARALAKDPADRFQSAEEMASALDRLDDDAPVAPSLASRRWRVAAIVSFLAVLLIVGWFVGRGEDSVSPDSPGPLPRPVQNLLEIGNTQWLRGNHPENLAEVLEKFEKAKGLAPDSAVTHGHLAVFKAEKYFVQSRSRAEDRDEALEHARDALELNPESSLARVARARIALMDEELSKGEDLAREAIALAPSCGSGESCDLAYLVLGESLWIQGEKEEALAMLERGSEVGGGHIRCRLKMARIYEKSGESRKAEDAYHQVLELDGVQTTALNDLGGFLIKAGRFDDAASFMRSLYEQTGDAVTWNNFGYILYENRLWDLAEEVYQQAHEGFEAAGRLVPSPLMAIGDIHTEQGLTAEAREYYLKALAVFDAIEDPGVERRGQRAVCLAKLGRLEEAEQAIEELLDRAPDVSNLLKYAGRIYALQGDRESLFRMARRWKNAGQNASGFLDDPSFEPYEKDREYLQILKPELIPAS